MKVRKWARLLLVVTPFLAGCGDFWQNPNGNNDSFSLSNSGNITVSSGVAGSGTSTITVTPGVRLPGRLH